MLYRHIPTIYDTQREVNIVKLLLKFTVLRNVVFESKICVALVHTLYAQNP